MLCVVPYERAWFVLVLFVIGISTASASLQAYVLPVLVRRLQDIVCAFQSVAWQLGTKCVICLHSLSCCCRVCFW
jgi:hypothetical protein